MTSHRILVAIALASLTGSVTTEAREIILYQPSEQL